VRSHAGMASLAAMPASLTATRLNRLRRADAIVRDATRRAGFDARIWQMPVVIVPVGTAERPDSVVLRPVDSVDGMTAQAVVMAPELLESISRDLLAIEGICAVFYDVTNKPPATIEWE
jgi:GMP synthase (glutamine-hydrolysing)